MLHSFINNSIFKSALLSKAFFLLIISTSCSAEVYLTPEAYLSNVEQKSSLEFDKKTLWLKKELQSEIKNILDHKYPKLRLRFYISKKTEQPTTIWYLDEIGKERPISFAITVKNNRVQNIRVLEFRESRGYEIHIPAFSKQFDDIGIKPNGNLDKNIDGITGATMSVKAMKKMAQLAIFLHHEVVDKYSSTKENDTGNML